MADNNHLLRLQSALIAADKAGNTDDARRIAREISVYKSLQPQEAQSQAGSGFARAAAAVNRKKAPDPTEGMSTTEKVLAGAGKAFYDVGRGVGNIVTDAYPDAAKYGFATRSDTDEARKRDAPLMNTGAGIAGNVGGNIAIGLPLARLPGASTILGGASIGAGLEALQPVGVEDSRLANMGMGAAFGGVIPAAIKGAKIGKAALIDPLTDSGRTKMAARMIARSSEDPITLARTLTNAKGNAPGFMPTVGQAGNDGGVASLERAMRANNPAAFNTVDTQQRKALADAVRVVAGTPETLAEAIAQRKETAGALYQSALDSSNINPITPYIKGQVTQLMGRPSIQSAAKDAERWALERGAKPTGVGDLRAMHDMKMALDDAIAKAKMAGAGGEVEALNGTKQKLVSVMEKLSPDYSAARQVYADMSRPINQMEIGTNLYNRLVPAIAEADAPLRLNAGSYAQALRNRDQLAKLAIGRDFKFGQVMDADQIAALEGVGKDASMRLFGEAAGKGVGSDTVQKIAMSHLSAEAGVPNWLSGVAGVIPGGGMLRNAAGLLYGLADAPIQRKAAQMLINPQDAAAALGKYGLLGQQTPSLLTQGAQGLMFSAPLMLNASQ